MTNIIVQYSVRINRNSKAMGTGGLIHMVEWRIPMHHSIRDLTRKVERAEKATRSWLYENCQSVYAISKFHDGGKVSFYESALAKRFRVFLQNHELFTPSN